MSYKTVEEIEALVKAFENGTISRDEWRHAEHLTVALYYLSNNDFPGALGKMREGIFNLLRSFAIDLSKEMPYHETLTVFWMKTVADFAQAKTETSLVEICSALIAAHDKDFPLRFYSRECLFSDAARSQYIKPDLVNN
jgi:hypothetical protein